MLHRPELRASAQPEGAVSCAIFEECAPDVHPRHRSAVDPVSAPHRVHPHGPLGPRPRRQPPLLVDQLIILHLGLHELPPPIISLHYSTCRRRAAANASHSRLSRRVHCHGTLRWWHRRDWDSVVVVALVWEVQRREVVHGLGRPPPPQGGHSRGYTGRVRIQCLSGPVKMVELRRAETNHREKETYYS